MVLMMVLMMVSWLVPMLETDPPEQAANLKVGDVSVQAFETSSFMLLFYV